VTLPRSASLITIERVAGNAYRQPGTVVLLAGAPAVKAAPSGVADILKASNGSGLGFPGGLTLIKSAAAFGAPVFKTRNEHKRTGTRVEHYAHVERTTARDATHDCFYPAPGDHLRPQMTQQIDGRTYNHYWRISSELSELIRRGEQEHLDDAARAYELTYKKIQDEINTLVGKPFGPAKTPGDAELMAERALAARLPRELGTDPANWIRVLDRLLVQSRTRDTNGWHSLSIDPPVTEGDRIVHPVSMTPGARIGSVPSSQVVNY
jgi:hypothetical protein